MAKILSFASWNVEHFSGKEIRAKRIIKQLKEKDPDVFGVYEVKSNAVYYEFMDQMPTHNYTITETNSPLLPEILVGVRKEITSFVTQRDEYRAKVPSLRPGALAGLRVDGVDYGFLFLHTKSFDAPRDWGLRDDMFKHVASLKRSLDKKASPEKAKFVCLGDLNTMGLNTPYNNICDLNEDQEIDSLTKRMKSVKMKRLEKTHEHSWWNGKNNWQPSKLDHVFASNELEFKQYDGKSVEVIGWPQETTETKKKKWIDKYSDHALLYGEIHS